MTLPHTPAALANSTEVVAIGIHGVLQIADWSPMLRLLAKDLSVAASEPSTCAAIVRLMIDQAHLEGCYRDVARQLGEIEAASGDLLTLSRLEPYRLEASRLDRVLPLRPHAHPNAVHGTPITPRAQLQKMRGASFCVSYYAPEQLNDCIALLGSDSMLLLDNGAFSAWRKGHTMDAAYWAHYWAWAIETLSHVDQAVAVIPDVIDGDAEQNMAMITDALDRVAHAEHRLMPVWHLHEPLGQLQRIVEMGFRWIAFGSSGGYSVVGTPAWDARIDAAFDTIHQSCAHFDDLHPRIHMMRGLGQLPRGRHPFSSADSTNVARNHARQSRGGEHIERFRSRIEADRFPVPRTPVWPHPNHPADAMAPRGVQAALSFA